MQGISAMLRECDVVFLNGENFIRPETRKGRMLLFLAYITKTVFNKPCVLSNLSVDMDEPKLAEIVHEVLPLLDQVHFREATSAESCSPLLAADRWQLIPDVAWAMPAKPLAEWCDLAKSPGHFSARPDSAEGFNPEQPYITVCASSVFSLDQYKNVDKTSAFIELCQRLQDEFGQVVLSAPCEPDVKIMRKVQAALELPLLGINLPVRKAIDVIGNAAVHVGGRWHPGIFAATGGTPTVALSANTHKINSLMQQLQLDAPVFDVLKLENHIDEIVAQAHTYIKAGATLREKLQRCSRELGAEVEHNLDFVKRLAGSMKN